MSEKNNDKWVDYYKDYYTDLTAFLDQHISSGEVDLSRLLYILDKKHIAQAAPYKVAPHPNGGVTLEPIRPGEPIQDGLSFNIRAYRPALYAHGLMQVPPYVSTIDALPNMIVDYLNAYPIDAVVDMGGGYGRSLFFAYLFGSRSDVKYWCMDTSPTARDIFDRLKGLCPKLDIEYVMDNYTSSDFSFLGEAKNVLLVTRGVVVLTPSVPEETIERWTKLAPTVYGIHLEPIGYQIKISNPQFDQINRTQAKTAQTKNMNLHFMEYLVNQRDKKNLVLQDIRPHMFPEWDPSMPKSLVSWRTPPNDI